MKRRSVLKAISVLGAVAMVPPFVTGRSVMKRAEAVGVTVNDIMQAKAVLEGEIGYSAPAIMPQVINVFMYGGPSELAGNLSNMDEIDMTSQNNYDARLVPSRDGSRITANNFWSNAGGTRMERAIAQGDMTIYRTMMRRIQDTKAHRTSIVSNQTGMTTGDDAQPGMGTTIAALLSAFNVELENLSGSVVDGAGNPSIGSAPEMLPISDSLFPLSTFEGDSLAFSPGTMGMPSRVKPMSLDQNLNNPYSRIGGRLAGNAVADARVDELANSMMDQRPGVLKIREALEKRAAMDAFVGDISGLKDIALPADPENPLDIDGLPNLINYGNSRFAERLRAAVTLTLYNPSSIFVALNTDGGLGGWDDHSAAQGRYATRMESLMAALEAAAKHIRVVRAAQGRPNNIIINCFGEFGRNVNLNNSMGWDHGNNQNLYTVGGNDLPGRALGKLVGTTERVTEGTNRQFTEPTQDSFEFEPASVAASLYRYIGVSAESAAALTGGAAPIDEVGAPNLFV